MITLSYVEAQIEIALKGNNSAQNIRDFALLCIARDNLKAAAANPDRESASKRDAIRLTNYSADLNTVPTIEQIEDAIGIVTAKKSSDLKRIRDARTWANIISQKN